MATLIKFLSAVFFVFVHSYATAQRALITPDGKGAVATVNPLATKLAIDSFAKGGNAIDAAVSAAYALGVVDSHNSGIGGGCFILVRFADGELLAIDAREMAPAAAHRDMYLVDGEYQKKLSKTGALASGIPGSVLGLEQMQKQGGRLKLSELILPAADIAKQGFAIDAVLTRRLNAKKDDLASFPASKKIFVKADGKPWKEGDVLVQKDLAKTYRKLAKHGSSYFYSGKFPKRVEKWMQANQGLIRASDFKNYHTVLREPLETKLGAYTLYGFPPPSSGGIAVAQILGMLEASGHNLKTISSADRYTLIVESMRRAFADRAHWLGDADFVKVPKNLVAQEYINARIKGLDLKKPKSDVSHGIPKDATTHIFKKHTTHIATADAEGNWVAITTTLNTSFGSKVVVPGTGVLLNNQMDDFSAQPGVPNAFGLVGAEANAIAGKKRPLSSMSPSLVLKDGKPVMTIGAAGGPTIISQVAQGIFNYLMLGKTLPEAIGQARVHHQWQPDMVLVDKFMEDSVRKQLEQHGYRTRDWPGFGATQAIVEKNGKFTAVSEPRLDRR